MALAHSKVTAQGQVSVPSVDRRKLGIGPGSAPERDQEADKIVVQRLMRFSSEDVHRALFPGRVPRSKTLDEMKQGLGGALGSRIEGLKNVVARNAPPRANSKRPRTRPQAAA